MGFWELLHTQPSNLTPEPIQKDGSKWRGPIVTGLSIGLAALGGDGVSFGQLGRLAIANYGAWQETAEEIKKEDEYRLQELANWAEAALNEYKRLLQQTPSDARLWFHIGVAHTNIGENDEALRAYDRSLSIEPSNSPCSLSRAALLGVLGRLDEGVAVVNELLERAPANEFALLQRGVLLNKKGEKNQALDCFNRALEINSHLENAWFNKAVILDDLGRHEEAFQCYELAREANPHLELPPLYDRWLDRAGEAFAASRFEDAVNHYQRALAFRENQVPALVGLAKSLNKTDRHEDALQVWLKAHTINSSVVLPWNELVKQGLQAVATGSFSDAVAAYERAIEMNAKYSDAWFHKGVALKILERFDEALECWESALALNPKLEMALFNKADVLGRAGRFEEAAAACEQMVGINPHSKEAWFKWGAALVELGHYAQALKCFEEAGRLRHPHSAQAGVLCSQFLFAVTIGVITD
jgi:tetratricopeptide (TPR) repeat protein